MGYVKKHSSKWDDTIIQPVVKTVEKVVEDPKALAMVALTVFAPGVGTAIGSALGLGSGIAATVVGNTIVNTALNGGDVEKALISSVIPIAGAEVAKMATTAFVDLGMSGALADAAGKATAKAAVAEVTGQDPAKAFITSAVSSGVNAATKEFDILKELPKSVQQAATSGITAGLTGGDAAKAATNSLMSSGISSLKTGLKDYMFPSSNEGATAPKVADEGSISPNFADAGTDQQLVNAFLDEAPEYMYQEQFEEPVTNPVSFLEPDEIEEFSTNPVSFLEPDEIEDAGLPTLTNVGQNDGYSKVEARSFGFDPEEYPIQDFGVPADQNIDSYQQTLQEIFDNDGATSQWMPNEDGTQTIVNDDGSTVTINENNEIVFATPASNEIERGDVGQSEPVGQNFGFDPEKYPVQNFGVPADQNMDSYQQTLKEIWDNGGLTSQWMSNEDGTKTMVNDDGSTVSINENNEIIHTTPATDNEVVNTPAQTATKPAAPKPAAPKPAAPKPAAPKPTTPAPKTTAPKPTTPNSGNPKTDIGQKLINAAAAGLLTFGTASALKSLTNNSSKQQPGTGSPQQPGTGSPQQPETGSPQQPGTGSPQQPATGRDVLKMDWNQQNVQPVQRGIAYGQQFLNPTFTSVKAAAGGLMSLAGGGMLGSYSDGGRLLRGPGDGMSDNIPASIANKQPARLADGEFVVPADVVSHLGNGSTEAGSRVLYEMMSRVRKARTGNPKQGKQIKPQKFMPK